MNASFNSTSSGVDAQYKICKSKHYFTKYVQALPKKKGGVQYLCNVLNKGPFTWSFSSDQTVSF